MLNKNIKNVYDNYPAWLWASLEAWFWEPGYLSVSSLTTIASRQLTHPSVFKNIWNKTQFGLGQQTAADDGQQRYYSQTFDLCLLLRLVVLSNVPIIQVQQRIVVNIISINCTLLIMDLNLLKTERKTDFHTYRSSSQQCRGECCVLRNLSTDFYFVVIEWVWCWHWTIEMTC